MISTEELIKWLEDQIEATNKVLEAIDHDSMQMRVSITGQQRAYRSMILKIKSMEGNQNEPNCSVYGVRR